MNSVLERFREYETKFSKLGQNSSFVPRIRMIFLPKNEFVNYTYYSNIQFETETKVILTGKLLDKQLYVAVLNPQKGFNF